MTLRAALSYLILGFTTLQAAASALPDLRVAADKRHLETTEGKPFFLLADTAWELFHRLTREETQLYLQNRTDKGFNTILAVALAEFEFDQPNAAGDLPLENNDPTKPREAYFAHVDWVIDQAAQRGLYTGLLPTWGDKWNKKWGKGPEIFTAENAAIYGERLGRRYADKPVIWVLGGDRPIETDQQRAIIRAMAAGLKKGDGGRHLITYHPMGGKNSSDYWPDEPWLDFHMFQSGHSHRAKPNYDMNAKNLALPALKPTLDGEPCYEDHPVRNLMKDKKATEWFDDYDVRRAAWWSVLSGACGHVYGTHSIWQFHDLTKRRQQTDARTPWQQAMDLPGAVQMGVMRTFIEGLDWTKLRREDGLWNPTKAKLPPESRMIAAISADQTLGIIYLPDGWEITINPAKFGTKHSNFEITGIDPSNGRKVPVEVEPTNGGRLRVTRFGYPGNPGTSPPNHPDWLLLIRKKP